MAKQGPRPGEIPKQVIPLPDPPSECGSAVYCMSDGSITASVLFPTDDGGSMHTADHDDDYDMMAMMTMTDIDLEKQESTVEKQEPTVPPQSHSHSPVVRASPTTQTKRTLSPPRQQQSQSQPSNRPPSVLKPHRYSSAATSSKNIHHQQQQQPRNEGTAIPCGDSIPSSSKKKVTLMVQDDNDIRKEGDHHDHNSNSNDHSTLSYTDDSDNQAASSTKKTKRNQPTRRRRWCCCSSTVIYSLFGVAITLTMVAVGINVLFYLDRQNSSNNNNIANPQQPPSADSTTHDFAPPSATPINANTTWTPPNGGVDVDANEDDIASMIRGIVTNQFRVDLPEDDDLAPTNQAVQWLIEEAEEVHGSSSTSSSSTTTNNNNNNTTTSTQVYSTLEKFSQRFAALVLRYALAESTAAVSATFAAIPQKGIDECNWEGIVCDDDDANNDGMIVQVDFSDFALTGTIPNEVKFLQKLTVLDLSNNQLQGSIPNELYDLKLMEKVYLYQNQLSGTLSQWIGQWDNLEVLHLASNRFKGPIPQQLESDEEGFRPLKYLNLYDNRFTGTIPSNLRLRDLSYLDLGRNVLYGSIPSDIGENFVGLRQFHIDHNRLSGPIPETIPTMANGRLESFLANHNFLTGRVPDNWEMFSKMSQYTLHENNFDSLGESNCNFNVFTGGNCVEFTADCSICTCQDLFCDRMCALEADGGTSR